MNRIPTLLLVMLVSSACGGGPEGLPQQAMSPGKPQAPVAAYVLDGPQLQVGVPAQLKLDVRTGIRATGVEIAIEGDAGITVVDYAPKRLPATLPAAGRQVLVDVVPTSGGTHRLTARLVLQVGGERQTRILTLPLSISGPVTVQPAAEKPSRPPVRDAAGELVQPLPADTSVREGR